MLAIQAVTAEDVLAVNSRDQQMLVDAVMQERIQRKLLENGVTIVSGVNTYIESAVTIGTDTVIEPFSYIGRDSSVGSDCVIGPFANVPPGTIVPDGSNIVGRPSNKEAW